MWLLTRMAIVFYVTIIWTTSIAVVLFVLHLLDFETINLLLSSIYNDKQARIVVGCIAVGIVAVSILLENLIYGSRRRERTIAFDNPTGQVIVSLAALEDLIKRLIVQLPEVKEIRPCVIAIKKGLEIEIKLVLRHEVNIPDLTGRLQDLVRKKIEEAIGMEGKIIVRIHVIKVSLDDLAGKRGEFQININPQVPFHGYRA